MRVWILLSRSDSCSVADLQAGGYHWEDNLRILPKRSGLLNAYKNIYSEANLTLLYVLEIMQETLQTCILPNKTKHP